MTYQEIINKLNNREPFSFSRFGDGEFACMLGKQGANCDGHEYFPDLGERLNKAWSEPKGIIGTQRYGQAMYPQFKHTGIDADILHKASINGALDSFFNALEGKEIVLVGPRHLRSLDLNQLFIQVPNKNAWLEYDAIKIELEEATIKGDVVLYCCGMMAEVLIWDMYSDDFTQIDCGSVFDPYVGINSRQYHKKLKI